jgi:hypothetical protein
MDRIVPKPPALSGRRRDHFLRSWPLDVAYWPILLQKSFWDDERKLLEPLMRFTRGDVRGHIVSPKIDHGPP